MKTILLLAGIIFSALSSSATEPNVATVFSAEVKLPPPSFSFVRGHKQGQYHTVTWGMTNNSGINHFIIECTYEDPTDPYSVWQTIGVMPSTNRPIFKFTDAPVLPGTLNYRVLAVMEDNSTITSWYYSTTVE